jgi:hypothetical protein
MYVLMVFSLCSQGGALVWNVHGLFSEGRGGGWNARASGSDSGDLSDFIKISRFP